MFVDIRNLSGCFLAFFCQYTIGIMPDEPLMLSSLLPFLETDAINLAVRFGAPIYVNKDIASKMARTRLEEHTESHHQIVRSCKWVTAYTGWLTTGRPVFLYALSKGGSLQESCRLQWCA